jgi:CHAT domain-containing protein
VYERATALYAAQGDLATAFLISERGRARSFLDSLLTGEVQLDDQTSAVLLAEESAAYARLRADEAALARLKLIAEPDQALLRQREHSVATSKARLEQSRRTLAEHNRALVTLVSERVRQPGLTEIQQELDPSTALIAYQVGDTQTLAFILTQRDLHLVRLNDGQEAIRRLVVNLRDTADAMRTPYAAEATELYRRLVKPVIDALPDRIAHLAIVPNDDLHLVPFAALSDGQQYLGERYTLSLLPSASTLVLLPKRGPPTIPVALVLGNPDGSLRFATSEAQAVAGQYHAAPLIGAAASETALRAHGATATIIHIAAHGHFDSATPLKSSLSLAPEGTSDGQLEAAEIYGLHLNQARLVTLSACDTNIGDPSAGDEVVSLTRAFFFAGAPTVVSSLWPVDDEATERLMSAFYRELGSGTDAALALQRAQAEVRRDDPIPEHWAGFTISGVTGPVAPPAPNVSAAALIWIFISGLLGLSGYLLMRYRRRRVLADRVATIIIDGKPRALHVTFYDQAQATAEAQVDEAQVTPALDQHDPASEMQQGDVP